MVRIKGTVTSKRKTRRCNNDAVISDEINDIVEKDNKNISSIDDTMCESSHSTSKPPQISPQNIQLYQEYCVACSKLNMDTETRQEAFNIYTNVLSKTKLDGTQIHWLACSLYTVSLDSCNKNSRGYISLTNLLKVFQLTWLDFFNKMNKIKSLLNGKVDNKLEILEKKFSVSCVIYRKFFTIFTEIFHVDSQVFPSVPSKRNAAKNRKFELTVEALYTFSWTLYLHVKAHYPQIAQDVINSYHLLICAMDWIYCSLYHEKSHHLLNLSIMDESKELDIIQKLCQLHQGVTIEAKMARKSWWNSYISKLFERGALQRDTSDKIERDLSNDCVKTCGFFDKKVFIFNRNSINKFYEEFLFKTFTFDERIFIDTEAHKIIGVNFAGKAASCNKFGFASPGKSLDANLFEMRNKKNRNEGFQQPHTPLTGRRYLADKFEPQSPDSVFRHNVGVLNSLIINCNPVPSPGMVSMMNGIDCTISKYVGTIVKSLSEKFSTSFSPSMTDVADNDVENVTRNHLLNGLCLYWKCFELILTQENNRQDKKESLKRLLEKDVFHTSLFSCCMEIILFSHRSDKKFPWIITTLNLESFQFYKIIETIVRTLGGLSRDIVKHLNRIEESILDSMAWESNSSLWNLVEKNNNCGPCCADVMLPRSFQSVSISDGFSPDVKRIASGQKINQMDLSRSPIVDPGLIVGRCSNVNGIFASPLSTALRFERESQVKEFNSTSSDPQRAILAKTTRRRLFPEADSNLLGNVVNSEKGVKVIVINNKKSENSIVDESKTIEPIIRKSTFSSQSLSLFFRKIYHLASVRMRNLCSSLGIDWETQRKIWTIIEFSLTTQVSIMKNRHIDVLIMCGIYVVTKISKGQSKSFTEIMKLYRGQPHSQSHVYRQVLISSIEQVDTEMECDSKSFKKSDDNFQKPLKSEYRADMITFYNKVYVVQMSSFVMKFSNYLKNSTCLEQDKLKSPNMSSIRSPPLSPIPIQRQMPMSPRRISDSHSLFVSPHKGRRQLLNNVAKLKQSSDDKSVTKKNTMVYCFDKSPSKQLSDINEMVKNAITKHK